MIKYTYITLILLLGSCISTETEPHEKYDHDLLYRNWIIKDVTQQGDSKLEEYRDHMGIIWEFKSNGVLKITSPTGVYTGTWEFSNKGVDYLADFEYYYGEPIIINCYYYEEETFYLYLLENNELIMAGVEGFYFFN